MGSRRPPDILRKSHAHSDRDPRAREKQDLRQELDAAREALAEGRALLIGLDGVVYRANALLPGAAEAIRWLAAERIPHLFVANATSGPRQALVEKLAAFGIPVVADDILAYPGSADSIVSGELPPEFFEAALKRLGTAAGATFMIGSDHRIDVGSAKAAGLKAVLVTGGEHRSGDLEFDIKPDHVLDSLADLPKLFS